MKTKNWLALFLALLLALGASPAALADEIPPPEDGAALEEAPGELPDPGETPEPVEPPLPEETPEPEETPVPEETPEPEEAPAEAGDFRPSASSGVFQEGAFEGPQTIPGEPMTAALDWEDGAYQTILESWRNRDSKADLRSLGILHSELQAFWDVCDRVQNDHPELFYSTGGMTAYNDGTYLTSADLYYRDFSSLGTTLEEAVQDFEAAAEKALEQIQGVTDDVEKALILHDYLAVNCRYNWEVATGKKEEELKDPNSYLSTNSPWNAYGVLVRGDAVCQGYGLAYKYLLNRAGIDAVYLSSKEMNHGWTGVRLGGRWYHTDVTWDDSTPDKEGHCGHKYFLLSDETISDQDHEHYGWTPLVSCGDKHYETGWAFNGVQHPFCRRDGVFYYLKSVPDGSYHVNRVFATNSLASEGTALPGDLGLYSGNRGALWLENRLYLIPGIYQGAEERVVMVYDLDAQAAAQAARFPYLREGSPDGYYSADYDRAGLRYNSETGRVEVVSSTRREAVASFPAPALSGDWAGAAPEEAGAAIAPGLSSGGAAAVLYGPGYQDPETPHTLWAVFYRNSSPAAFRPASAQPRVPGGVSRVVPSMVLAYPDLSDLPEYDSARLMLLTADGLVPVCAAG